MTMSAIWPAPAKLNLFLHVLGRRADGYHRLQTVFQFLDYGDELMFESRSDGLIRRVRGSAEVAADEDLVVRAGRALQAATGCLLGADIHLEKRIPIGAGLGGGSSDAATTLVALNQLWGTSLPPTQLAAIGLKLGADVPVFVHGHAAWAEGVGEQLTPVTLPEPWYAVVVPPVHVATASIFNAPLLRRDHPAISLEDFQNGIGENDCTAVTCAQYPLVAEALSTLGKFAPAHMSGTGSAVFAAFATKSQAQAAISAMPRDWSCFAAQGRNRSPMLA